MDVNGDVSGYQDVSVKLVDYRRCDVRDRDVFFPGYHIVVYGYGCEFHIVGAARREIQELEYSGELDGSRRNVYGLFHLDERVI